ncbi:sialoadhesin [Heteronotia binoei]|uniref:sialoadhesin n=1 Tax=Heteronotia binoei TaxID=13085 RepID=UPI002931DF9C|nr:sialoadhesin [Heteronotia binoei]
MYRLNGANYELVAPIDKAGGDPIAWRGEYVGGFYSLRTHQPMQETSASASWQVRYPASLRGVQGSCVLIPCTFDYPMDTPESITSIWYKDNEGQRIVAFHSSTPDAVDAQFQGRTELIGDALGQRNCTLLLRSTQTRDSGKYNFRFEIDAKNRWLEVRGVELTVADTPDSPTIASPDDLYEAKPVTFNCSSPYVCPYDSISLRWTGHNAETSHVSEMVQLDTGGVLQKKTLSSFLSWQDHHRKLSCEVAAGALAKAKEVTLQVKHSPKGVKVSISPSAKNIRVGDATTLACNVVSSYPEVTAYRWFKDGVACGEGQVKTIQSVTREDYGQYHCEAENPVGSTVAETATVYVFTALLTVSPSSDVQEGGTVTLTCDVPGEDKQEIHYSWFKNNIWMKEGTARTLIFHEVAAGDTGYYTCKVQNDKGSEKSQVVGLNVVYPPRPPTLALFQETQEGKLAIVLCTVDSNPQSTLSLFRGQQLIATTNSHSAPRQRIGITTTRNSLKLEIQKVVPEDAGEYQCAATNKYGNATTTRFFGAQTARVVVSPSEEVPEGERVTLTCLATLEPEEETVYTWYKNAKWLQEGRENSLIFPATISTDAGTFYCVAKNKKSTNTSPAVTLHVLYPPRQPEVQSFLETQEGHLGIIQCMVDSNPPSEIALYKGDTLIGSTSASSSVADPRVSVTPSHNALKVSIKGVTLEDEGRFVCSAQNRYGDTSTSVDFTAETARIILTPSPEVPEGQEVHLSCLVSSNASTSTNYTWFQNGLCLPGALGDSLVFPQVARGDAGIYFCRVESHGVSKSSASVTLSVLYPPEPPRVAVFVEAEKGRTALFHCSADSSPPAELSLYKGDHLIASTGSPSATLPRVRMSAAHDAMSVEMGDVVPEDEGSYRCVATNAYGSSATRLYFHVQTARVLASPSPELLEGDAAILTCDVLGSAPGDATFCWYKNSKRLPDNNSSTLAFPQITSRDAGSYHCKAHTAEEASLSVSPPLSLIVFYPPRKPQLTSFLQRQGGPVAVLQCTVDSAPQSVLLMFKGDELLASSSSSNLAPVQRLRVSASYNSLRVEIREVVVEDEGGYTCWASNLYGNSSVSITFTAGTARIWISPLDVLEGDSANLTCAIDSGAAEEPHYTWYKDHRWYTEGPSRTLSLPNVTVADAGAYSCALKTSERVWNSSLGSLNVLYPPKNIEAASFLEAQNGQVAILVCSVDSNPPSQLSLRQGNEVLASTGFSRDHGAPPDPSRMSVASSPNSLRLEILKVHLDDEGHYECLASNSIGTAKASLDLVVETTKVVISPSPEVREGDPVSLTCEDISSASNALYSWYKNAQWLAEGPADSLMIQAATPGDAGAYSCRVRNARRIRTSPPVPMHVLYAPKELTLVSFLETQSRQQAILQCAVESHPLSDLTLYKGHEIVASSLSSGGLPTSRLNVHRAHNFLKVEIKGVHLEDEGEYLCFANNTYGASKATVYFSVESARITVEPSPDIQEGSAANLTCLVASRAAGGMNYTWYKNSQWLQDGPGHSLLLEMVTIDDAGSYHCRAEGETGSVTSNLVLLNVLYAPRTPTLSAFLDNQSGRVGILRCQVSSHPRSELALYKGGSLLAHTQRGRPAAAPRLQVLQSYNSLKVEIRHLVAEDSGRYTCLASNPYGNGTAALDFSAETLSDLHFFKVMAGVFVGMACAAGLCASAFGVRRNWSRIKEQRKKWKPWRTQKVELVEMDKKVAEAQVMRCGTNKILEFLFVDDSVPAIRGQKQRAEFPQGNPPPAKAAPASCEPQK